MSPCLYFTFPFLSLHVLIVIRVFTQIIIGWKPASLASACSVSSRSLLKTWCIGSLEITHRSLFYNRSRWHTRSVTVAHIDTYEPARYQAYHCRAFHWDWDTTETVGQPDGWRNRGWDRQSCHGWEKAKVQGSGWRETQFVTLVEHPHGPHSLVSYNAVNLKCGLTLMIQVWIRNQ